MNLTKRSAPPIINFKRRSFALDRVIVRISQLRFFSDRKTVFMRNLTARHIGVLIFCTTAEKLVSVLKDMEELEKRFCKAVGVTVKEETEAYSVRKKFILIEKQVALLADKEIGELDDIIATLAGKPD